MESAVTSNLKYVTSFKDRHNKRRFYFRYRGQKFKLPGKPNSAEFMATYARYLAAAESGELGRKDIGYLKGSIGWVIERFLASDMGFGKLKPGSQRNYRRWLDTIKAEVGRFQIGDLSPAAVRAMRDSIKIKTATTTADACVMVVSVLWKFASEFCQLPLGHNPAHGVARVHTDRKSHDPWPDDVIDKLLTVADAILRLAVYLLLYTGQREGDVVAMKWDDIRAQPDAHKKFLLSSKKQGQRSGYHYTAI